MIYIYTASLFFSGVSTIIFFIVTGGRVPSYLGCSGSFASIILTISNYTYTPTSGMNTNIGNVQGAIFILSLTYAAVALFVMIFSYKWLEFFMPPSKLY
jgi:xanthine/uracil permease